MRILITGVDGYIGCVLVPKLMAEGHEVVGLATEYYREGWLSSDPMHLPVNAVHNEVFNVGCGEEDYRIPETAEFVGHAYPDCDIHFGGCGGDNRSYRVNLDKIANGLPGFCCARRADEGAIKLRDCFERIQPDAARFRFRAITRLMRLEYLIRTVQIDEAFYWAT